MRLPMGWVSGLFLCLTGMTQGTDTVKEAVTLNLSLREAKRSFTAGEAIFLDLTVTANEPGLSLNITTTEPASPIDTLVVSPLAGVFPWPDEQACGRRYSPDYAALAPLEVGKPETVSLILNAVYRFDAPGHYSVQVVSGRVLRGGVGHYEPVGRLTSNLLSFDIAPMDEKEEAERAARLEQRIRQGTDMRRAQKYAEELDWLAGDASARVKLSLFLHPKTFYPFSIDVSRGLWIARNRALVVAELERALRDPSQSLVGSSLLQTAVGLKARLGSPIDPADPSKAHAR